MFKTIITAALVSFLTGTNTATVSNTNTVGRFIPPARITESETDEIGRFVPPAKADITDENGVDYQEIFDEAMSGMTGCDYTATQMIEIQLVNGTNYKFIAKSTPVYPGAKTKTVQVTVHESLDGEISIYDILEL